MDRHTPTVSELVRRDVEVADPDDRDEARWHSIAISGTIPEPPPIR
jgi:hypothetical protein